MNREMRFKAKNDPGLREIQKNLANELKWSEKGRKDDPKRSIDIYRGVFRRLVMDDLHITEEMIEAVMSRLPENEDSLRDDVVNVLSTLLALAWYSMDSTNPDGGEEDVS